MKIILSTLFFLIGFFIAITPALAAPPANFQTTLKIGSGLTAPTGFDIAPDGRIFILQRTGEIKIYKNGQLLPNNFAVLPSDTNGDKGLIGLTFDPDFLNNHNVYFYYVGTDQINRLVRFDATTDTGTNGPLVLYESSDQAMQLHQGGTIEFGPDGKLYLSIGDNGKFANSQDLTTIRGKILRLNKDGTTPPDNPFVNTLGAKKEIWAYGFRNPFRFQFDPATGNLFEGDVGEATWEEINLVKAGKNYGWPNCEGVCNPSNPLYTDPIYSYNHNGGSAAVVGGPVYHGQMFPSNYQGRLFFGDYALGFIKTLSLDSNGNSTGVSDFDNSSGSVVDMKVDPKDGSLYYLTIFPGNLYQVTYSTGVKVPIASASADILTGNSPLTVHFSSSGSLDPNGLALTYNWNFGDNTNSNLANPTKIYNTSGKYIVSLTVGNGTYTALAPPIIIQVGTPPTLTISSPTNGATYKAGDVINYSASATDSNGQTLADSAISTTVVFHHQTHIHPFLGPITGKSGQFTIPTTGEVSADTWYEIDVTATDSNGLTTTSAVFIYPIKVNLTFNTNISGLNVLLNGQPTQTPTTIQGVVNFVRTLGVPLVQVLNGVVYSFHQWSDGGAVSHNIITPNSDTTYTANFDQAQPFSGQYFTNQTLSGTPTLTRQDNQIDFDWSTTPPDPSIPHDHYSVRWTKSQYFPAGRYTFTASSDDGSRLYIGNNLVINNWVDQAFTAKSADVDLTAGNHDIRMEYYQNAGGALVKLSWDYALIQPSALPTPTTTPTPTPSPTGTPIPNQKLGGLNLSSYCVSLSQTGASLSGSSWICNPSGTAIDMTQACIWQYQNPNAVAIQDIPGNPYSWSCYTSSASPTPTPTPSPTPSATPQTGYLGKYWNLTTNTFPPNIPTTTPTLTRTDPTINFVWNNGSPDPKINVDKFVVEWTQTFNLVSGSYTFTATSDDGIRVYVDNSLVINQWNDHASKTFTATKSLTTGNHNLKIDYYEHAGGAIAKFSFVKN